MTPTCEEAGTTVEPPVCPECEGAGLVGFWREPRNCETCDGTGYERGDNASLIASCPDTDEEVEVIDVRRETYVAGTLAANGFVLPSAWERIG